MPVPGTNDNELFTVTAIAYLQPATRGELSRLAGREISRDVIGRLKHLDLIAAGPRAPEPGGPYAYVTTRKFLAVFGLPSLRDLPDIEKLEDAGLTQRSASEADLDGALGIQEANAVDVAEEVEDVWDEQSLVE